MLIGVCQVRSAVGRATESRRTRKRRIRSKTDIENRDPCWWASCQSVNHSLSPLWAPPSGDCSVHVWPPFVERQMSAQKVFTNRLR